MNNYTYKIICPNYPHFNFGVKDKFFTSSVEALVVASELMFKWGFSFLVETIFPAEMQKMKKEKKL